MERTLALRALVQQREQEVQERETEQQCVWRQRDGGPRSCSAFALPTLTPALPRLHDHFDSIQRISDTTTLPTLLPPLRARLCALADVDALTRRLQEAASGAAPLTPAEKVAVWEQLKVQSASWWPPPCRLAARACVVA